MLQLQGGTSIFPLAAVLPRHLLDMRLAEVTVAVLGSALPSALEASLGRLAAVTRVALLPARVLALALAPPQA